MSVHHFTARVLSPIHVGDGSSWTPEDFKLDGEQLIRFDAAAVVASMDDRQRRRFLEAIGRPNVGEQDLRDAQRIVREACRPEQERERIAISPGSCEEIRAALDRPGRSGRVHPFIRGAGRPFLPGSALKGAIRTALLSRWVNEAPHRYQGQRPPDTDRLQAEILGKTDGDPFRFLRVADVELPLGATRIERVQNLKRKGETNAMQMHFECLQPGARLTIALDLRDADSVLATAARVRDAARRADRSDAAPRRMFDATTLFSAVDDFFRGRFEADGQRFFPKPWYHPPAAGSDGFPILLRVGRFCHFESASVEGLRQGWQAQAKRHVAEGSTRAIVERDGQRIPFGWLLLAPVGREEALGAEPRIVVSRPGLAAGAAPPRTSLVGRRGTVDSDPVKVEKEEGDMLVVCFLDTGDIESVPRHAFKVGPER